MKRSPPRVSLLPLLILLGVVVAVGLAVVVLRGGSAPAAPAPVETPTRAPAIATAAPTDASPVIVTVTRPPATATASATARPAATVTATRAPAPTANPLVMRDQRIYALNGTLAFRGDVDLRPTFDRIERGVRDPHDNDGSVFGNFERRLPVKSDRQYYREYVIRTPNLREVGPQRLIMGKGGEAYYTPDHYESFVKVR